MKAIQLKTILLFFILILNSNFLRAQCSGISNSYSCQITVDILLYDGGLCSNICETYTGIVINPSGFYSIACGACPSGACNIEVTITDIAGQPVGPYFADFNSGQVTITGPGTCPSGVMYYDSNSNTFKVQ